jgi:hypothetical protein
MKTLLMVTLSCVVVGLTVSPVSAATYYVATTGSNLNDCTTQAQNPNTPKLTIGAALACIGTASGAGANHVVEVAAGTYAERVSGLPSGTSWAAPFTLRAKAGATVTIKPTSSPNGAAVFDIGGSTQYTVIEGFVIDGTAQNVTSPTIRWEANYVRLLNNEIKNNNGSGGIWIGNTFHHNEIVGGSIHDGAFLSTNNVPNVSYPIYLEANDNLISGVEFYNFPRHGIMVYNGYSGANNTNNVLIGNRIHDGAVYADYGSAIYIGDMSTGSQVYNNVIYSMNGHGIEVKGANQIIYNNTVYGGSQNGIFGSATNAVLKNNIVYGNATGQILLNGGTFAANLCNATDAGCQYAGDPSFVDAAAFDFHLQSGSPAKDQGVTLAAVTTDKDGVSRPQGASYDIGAYEVSVASPPAAPTNLQLVK